MKKAKTMNTFLKSILVLIIYFCGLIPLSAQPYNLEIQIQNQPDNPVVFGRLEGDNFISIDSAKATNGSVQFLFPENAQPGVYRLILGKTGYAKVMNDDPQQLDFIFNNENINLKTDFKNPLGALWIYESDENRFYYDFMQRQREYEKAISLMEQEVDQYWAQKDTTKAINLSNEFNQLQMEWDLRLVQTIQQNHDKFASKLIALEREPLKDGFLSPAERKEAEKTNFFKHIEFTDASLINSQAYTDKIFEFLVLFNDKSFNKEQRTKAYLKAVDIILPKLDENTEVRNFVIAYLVHGFEVLGLKDVVSHIEAVQ